jgi:hypothetical protein
MHGFPPEWLEREEWPDAINQYWRWSSSKTPNRNGHPEKNIILSARLWSDCGRACIHAYNTVFYINSTQNLRY